MARESYKAVSNSVEFIIPCTSFDEHLRAAVESALADTDENIASDVCVVFDGPEQTIPEWLGGVRKRVCFTGRRSGAGAAINLGVRSSSADLIARLDSDDLSLPGRLEAQVRALRDRPDVLVVGTRARLVNEEGVLVGDWWTRDASSLRTELLRKNPFVHSSMMYRRQDILTLGGYDESCIRMQDYDLVLRFAALGELLILPDFYVHYRVHPGQTSLAPSNFWKLMRHISRRRTILAQILGESIVRQRARNLAYTGSQLLRYLGLRRPRYMAGLQQDQR